MCFEEIKSHIALESTVEGLWGQCVVRKGLCREVVWVGGASGMRGSGGSLVRSQGEWQSLWSEARRACAVQGEGAGVQGEEE